MNSSKRFWGCLIILLGIFGSNLGYALPPTCTDSTWFVINALPSPITAGRFEWISVEPNVTCICEQFTEPIYSFTTHFNYIVATDGNDPDQLLEYHRKPD